MAPCDAPGCSERAEGCWGGCLTLARAAHRFEKLVGSLYLGEIVRHVLIALATEKALFIGRTVGVLRTKDVLKTQQVLEIIE